MRLKFKIKLEELELDLTNEVLPVVFTLTNYVPAKKLNIGAFYGWI